MTEAATILKLIEEVDPADSEKLDEIDARVFCYLKGFEYAGQNPAGEYCFRNGFNGKTSTKTHRHRKFTRSRNALKTIRPNKLDWFFDIKIGVNRKAWVEWGLQYNHEKYGDMMGK